MATTMSKDSLLNYEEVVEATNSERFALALRRNGVEYIFGQSNPQTIMLAANKIGIKQISFRQENTGSYMAQAYGMCSNSIPVVAAQNGPAATLLVPGLAECYKASHPIVAIVDEIPRDEEDKNAFQELDHFKLFDGVAKWIKSIPSESRIEDYVDMAFIAAASGRPGPAVILCPKDMMYDTKKYLINKHRTHSYSKYPLDRTLADPKLIKLAAQKLMEAEQPFIYAGGGVISSNAEQELKDIQKTYSIPVATTTMGKGAVDEENPLTIGPIGYYMGKGGATKHLKDFIQSSDVIFLIGNRTNQNGTDSWTLLPEEATYIHLDIDSLEIGRNYESIRLKGDAKLTLEYLKTEMEKMSNAKRHNKKEQVIEVISNSRKEHEKDTEELLLSKERNEQLIKMEEFLPELNKQLTNDHVVVSDASFSSVWTVNSIQAKSNRKFIFPRGLAGLGWGMPMAMGAKIAMSDRKVFCLTGDGGFAHVWSELETCRREGIDVVVCVINNKILGYQKYAELARWEDYTAASDLGDVDYVAIAEACGLNGVKISNPTEIKDKLKEAFSMEGTVVIDLIADPKSIPPIPFMENI